MESKIIHRHKGIIDLKKLWASEEDKDLTLNLLVMPRYRITKYVEARSIKEALRTEAGAEIAEVIKEEPEAKDTPNTHAMGFHIPPDYFNQESYDPSP